MGIRLHKYLGYGLLDVKTKEESLADNRFNPKSSLLEHEPGSNEDYLAWLEDNGSEDNFLDRWALRDKGKSKGRKRYLEDCFAFNPEFGMPEVFVMQPIGCENWSRYDDIIDYMQEPSLSPKDNYRGHVKTFADGLYPFNSKYMDRISGEKLSNRAVDWHWAKNSETPDLYHLDSISKELGYADYVEALDMIAPYVPDEIRDIARFCELFTNEKTVLDLRPMLYTYWS